MERSIGMSAGEVVRLKVPEKRPDCWPQTAGHTGGAYDTCTMAMDCARDRRAASPEPPRHHVAAAACHQVPRQCEIERLITRIQWSVTTQF
mmetsp:Transcript_25094/g.58249  ORF Transcript_25094/g.58249 Transcript_25094/m.58249 type:complete len:91 (+) Transcript_25094:78-350(+)